MTDQTIEKRLADLEQEVAQLKAEVRGPKSGHAWLERSYGLFKDGPVYDEAMRLGAAWRRRENRKSIRELETQGLIDADPGHGSPDGDRSRNRVRRNPAKSSRQSGG